MLVLSTRLNEKVLLPDIATSIEVVAIQSVTDRLGISAPEEVRVLRQGLPDPIAEWGPEPEPGPGTTRDLWLLAPVALLACAALSVGLGALLYAQVLLGLAVFLVALAVFGFVLVPILTLRRQVRRTYR